MPAEPNDKSKTLFRPPNAVVICYPVNMPDAASTSENLVSITRSLGLSASQVSLPQELDSQLRAAFQEEIAGTDLLICVGGDGTVLKVAQLALESNIPILGIRLGRLGFLTDVIEQEIRSAITEVVEGNSSLFQRALISATLSDQPETQYALNDVVLGRDSIGGTISILAEINDTLIAEYRADGVIVATATGSTGYSLSAGGPILNPFERSMLVTPVAPHLTGSNSIVLSDHDSVVLTVARGMDSGALVSFDGMFQTHLPNDSSVTVQISEETVKFVVPESSPDFYTKVAERLGWLRPDYVRHEQNQDKLK